MLVALSLVVLMGFAAVAIDYGLGINERRQDQSAADLGVMGGGIDYALGESEIANGVLEYVWRNLPSATSASWEVDTAYRDAFRTCTDPDAASYGFNFQPVSEPNNTSTGGVWDGTGDGSGQLPCVSLSGLGFVRVRVPDQLVDAPFSGVLGFGSLTTHADAVAQIAPIGEGGILPFGLPFGTASGEMICLSDSSGGNSRPPCDGPTAGNFGTLKGRQFGNPLIGTAQNCTGSPLGDTLAINIAVGLDHFVTEAPDTSASNEVRDMCFNFGVNTLNTDTGFPNNGAEEGLVGPLPPAAPAGAVPRLLDSTNTVSLFGVNIDNTPLWAFIDPSLEGGFGGSGTDVPEVCDPDTFDNSSGYVPTAGWPYAVAGDWDNDGNADVLESWEHMQFCLQEYQTATPPPPQSGWEVLFLESMGDETRFAYTPQFFETNLGTGNSWLHVERFVAVWLQGTYWKRGMSWSEFHPGEGCDTSGGGTCTSSFDMKQLTAFTLPDMALPAELRGNPSPFSGGINPFTVLIYD